MKDKQASQLTEKEKKIRAEEDELFEKIKSPPILLDGVMDVLGDVHKNKELIEQRIQNKKKQREKDEKLSAALEQAAMNSEIIQEENAHKKRRR